MQFDLQIRKLLAAERDAVNRALASFHQQMKRHRMRGRLKTLCSLLLCSSLIQNAQHIAMTVTRKDYANSANPDGMDPFVKIIVPIVVETVFVPSLMGYARKMCVNSDITVTFVIILALHCALMVDHVISLQGDVSLALKAPTVTSVDKSAQMNALSAFQFRNVLNAKRDITAKPVT